MTRYPVCLCAAPDSQVSGAQPKRVKTLLTAPQFKQLVRKLETETLALCFAARHQATLWYAKLLVAGIVAYAFSPIDLIPDFIPVLGLLDDSILLPFRIALALKLIPPQVMTQCRERAAKSLGRQAYKSNCGSRDCCNLDWPLGVKCSVGKCSVFKLRGNRK